ncbi:MAG: GGDEF domain-containing protein, partial [Pseudomonadota bacterium]
MMSNLLGAVITLLILWPYFEALTLLVWGVGVLSLLLLRSLHMSNALANRRFVNNPAPLFWRLIAGSLATGLVWSATFIYVSAYIPVTLQYLMLLVIVIIAAISLAVMVIVREYFLVFAFSALWPIAWWLMAHLWDAPQNLILGLLILAVTAVLVVASNGIHETFKRMLALTWQQE